MIRYKGIEFDTVEELVAYQKAMGEEQPKVEKKVVVVQQEKKTRPYRRKKRMNRRWLPAEIEFMQLHYGEKNVTTMANKLKRTRSAVMTKAHELGLTTPRNKPSDHQKPMLRSKPKQVIDNEAVRARLGLLKEQKERFPKVYPLANHSQTVFMDMVEQTIRNRGKISLQDARATLDLVDGMDWDGRTWTLFCSQVILNMRAITQAKGIAEDDLRVVRKGNQTTIQHKLYQR
jgi:hypothetical protein